MLSNNSINQFHRYIFYLIKLTIMPMDRVHLSRLKFSSRNFPNKKKIIRVEQSYDDYNSNN